MRIRYIAIALISAAVLSLIFINCQRDYSKTIGDKEQRCPSLSAIDPNYGDNSKDQEVMIRGSDFSGKITIFVGAEELSDVSVLTTNLVKAKVPQGLKAGTYDLVLINGYGCSAILEEAYTSVDAGEIKVLSIEPDSAMNDVDTEAVIEGINFLQTATVSLGTLALEDVEFVSSNQIDVVIPFGLDEGEYDVVVCNDEESCDTLVDGFTVIESGALYVTSIEPNTGPNDVDVNVTITGRNFVETPQVFLGAIELQDVQFFSDDILAAVVQAGFAPAVYDLTVKNPDGETFTLVNAYTVTEPE